MFNYIYIYILLFNILNISNNILNILNIIFYNKKLNNKNLINYYECTYKI